MKLTFEIEPSELIALIQAVEVSNLIDRLPQSTVQKIVKAAGLKVDLGEVKEDERSPEQKVPVYDPDRKVPPLVGVSVHKWQLFCPHCVVPKDPTSCDNCTVKDDKYLVTGYRPSNFQGRIPANMTKQEPEESKTN